MSRATKELRRTLAPITGIPAQGNALLRAATPSHQGEPLAMKIKDRGQQVSHGLPKSVL